MTIDQRTIDCPNCGKPDGHAVILPITEESNQAFYCEYCESHFTVSDLYTDFHADPIDRADRSY